MQGFNMGRYYPPDASNPPSFNNSSHPLGKRANKISSGILTVRFELPFAVWCNHCTPPAIIGQGVRFNAEKKKVGNYHSTPIWSFRMKHSACGGWWEIQTDPQNSEYVVVEGARRRDYGPTIKDDTADGDLKFLTEEEKQKRREDAFANLEGKMEDKGIEKKNRERVEELYDKAEVWRDPYDINAKLRREFRGKRKMWQKEDKYKEGMQDKFSLGLDIVDETEADRTRAGLVEFGAASTADDKSFEALSWKPLFGEPKEDHKKALEPTPKTKKLKAEISREKSRLGLQQTLVGNTRAVVDPFLNKEAPATSRINLGILKRKRDTTTEDVTAACSISEQEKEKTETVVPKKKLALLDALVGYDSD
jgi:coiled-coil domain-containing protein 130